MQGWLTFPLAGQISKQNSLKKGLIIMFFSKNVKFSNLLFRPQFKKLGFTYHISLSGGFGSRCLKIGFCIIASGFNIILFFGFNKTFFLAFLIWQMDISPLPFLCVHVCVCMCVCVWMKARICWSKYSFIFFQWFFWKNKKNWFRPNEKEKTFRRLIVKEQVLSQTTNQWKHFWKSLWPLPNTKLF